MQQNVFHTIALLSRVTTLTMTECKSDIAILKLEVMFFFKRFYSANDKGDLVYFFI